MDNSIFFQLAIVLGISTFFGFLIRKLNLPLLIAYLFVGVLIAGIAGFQLNTSPVSSLPFIGVAFALFLTGMELDLREIGSLGKTILISGITQITITAIAGVTLASLFGFKGLEALYLGIGLSFSSTVVVVKLLLEKRNLTSLFGKLSIGVQLLEDMAALLVLMYLSLNSTELTLSSQESLLLAGVIIKALLLLLMAFVFSKYILSGIFKAISKSPELIFLTALAWCFIFVSIALLFGFSSVIGAFLAGVALASSPFHFHISSRIKPLRDFFTVLFFVYLGTQVSFGSIMAYWPLIIIFTLYTLLIKPLIYMLLFGAFGFRKHTIFQAGINLTQISEFSLIILITGVSKGIVSQSALSIMGFTVALSILLSSILISHSKKIYPLFRPLLDFFERKDAVHYLERRVVEEGIEGHVILIGANRVGGPIVDFLKAEKIPFLVLDFNPKVVDKLTKENVNVLYGDLADPEVFDNLRLEQAKLIISTATDEDDNRLLLAELKRRKIPAKVIVRAGEESQAQEFRKKGADYVIMPESVSADLLVRELKQHWPDLHLTRLAG